VCRAIALIDQPRRCNATISTTSSRESIPSVLLASTASSTATLRRTPDGTAAGYRPVHLGKFDEHIWGVWRERAHRAPTSQITPR
jgi:hypothetical protein